MQTLTEKIIQKKKELAGSIGSAESVRDFGGMWKVNGVFLTDAVLRLGAKMGSMVDKLKTPEYDNEVSRLSQPNREFQYVNADFRELATQKLEKTDVSLLNDVLLHQDNFTEVVKQVCNLTNKYIVVAQPFYNAFAIPSSCAMIQFASPEWKKKLWNEMWVDQRELDKYSVDIWMWAQSTQLMIDLFKGYGWKPKQDRGFTFPISNGWDYAGIIFERA